MENIIEVKHSDFTKHKIELTKNFLGLKFMYDGQIVRPNLKGQFKLKDDHGQERVIKLKGFLSPSSLLIDNKETINFGTPIPKLAYLCMLPSLFFLIGGAIGGAIAGLNAVIIASVFTKNISTVKKCTYSALSTVGFYLILDFVAYSLQRIFL